MFYYFSKMVKFDESTFKKYSVFQFLFSGHVFYEFLIKYLKIPGQIITYERYKGTLEILFNSRIKSYLIVIYSLIYKLAIDYFLIIVYLGVGIFLFDLKIHFDFLIFMQFNLIVLISIIFIVSFGMLGASMIVLFKKLDFITSGLIYFSLLAGGVYFPNEYLPKFILMFLYIFPINELILAFRELFFSGIFNYEILIKLLIYISFLTPFSLFIFSFAVKLSKKYNTLNVY